MTRLGTPCLLAGLILLTGCEHRTKTIFPETQGVVVDLETSQPVSGVLVSVIGEDGAVETDSDGTFALPAIVRDDTSVLLPVSGVYRATALMRAEAADGRRAFAPVDFINPYPRAESPVAIFLIDPAAAWKSSALPDTCNPPEKAVFALQLLQSGRAAQVKAWLDATGGYTFTLEQWLDRVLVRELASQCDLPNALLYDWMEDIDAFINDTAEGAVSAD